MGWERKVLVKGKKAKATKKKINRIRIYPPRTGNVAEIFQAGEPIILPPPSVEFQHLLLGRDSCSKRTALDSKKISESDVPPSQKNRPKSRSTSEKPPARA
jgi:hypothetical protein